MINLEYKEKRFYKKGYRKLNTVWSWMRAAWRSSIFYLRSFRHWRSNILCIKPYLPFEKGFRKI